MNSRDGLTPNERTRSRRQRRKRAKAPVAFVGDRNDRQQQLAYLFRRQAGRCFVCGEPAVLDSNGGKAGHLDSAVRFRTGSRFGAPGRVRPRVMAHRKCAQLRSDEIQASVSIEELNWRSGRFPTETYEIAARPSSPDEASP